MAVDQDAVNDVLEFWFADGMEEKWYKGGADFDRLLTRRFGKLHDKAIAGDLDDWSSEDRPALALVILLDQFSRNIGRGEPLAFAQDRHALAIAQQALERGSDLNLSERERQFFYLPLMHSENLDDQHECVARYKTVDNPPSLDSAHRHRDIIARFGRFPHRNKILGRASTVEELEFLKTHEGF